MAVAPLLLALALACPPPQTPAAVPTKVRSAALFKNGLAFVQRSGTVAAESASARIDALPVPTHGTFWVRAGEGAPALACAVARKSERVERVAATNLLELLRANVGRKLTLILGEKESLIGTLVSMPEPRALEEEEDRPRYGYAPQPLHSLLLFDTGSGISALNPAQVLRLASAEGGLNREFERRRPGTSLTLSFASATKAPAAFELCYLERGLTWVPSYSVDIGEEGQALLCAKAEVIDEAEELAGATLQFVTGFPNLQFAHVADPLALRGNLEAFLTALGRPGSVQEGQVMSQSAMSNSLDEESARLPVAPDALQSGAVEDLFLYEQRDVTLARGERGLYPLFEKRVPCEHVYEWKIPDTTLERRPRERAEREPPPQEEIWHSLRLSNDSGLPWTTAPAMTVKNGNLLGQDTLRYTAVGARTLLRITRALDLQGEQVEYETARERNAARFWGSSYDKVTVHGKLHVTSYKREAVRVEIEKRLQGELTKNPNQAALESLAEGLFRVNPNLRLSWSLPLEAGKALTLEYEYTLYVSS